MVNYITYDNSKDKRTLLTKTSKKFRYPNVLRFKINIISLLKPKKQDNVWNSNIAKMHTNLLNLKKDLNAVIKISIETFILYITKCFTN